MQNENYSCNYGYKYSMYLTREILSILSPYSSNISWYLSLVIMIMKTFHIRISHNYSFYSQYSRTYIRDIQPNRQLPTDHQC